MHVSMYSTRKEQQQQQQQRPTNGAFWTTTTILLTTFAAAEASHDNLVVVASSIGPKPFPSSSLRARIEPLVGTSGYDPWNDIWNEENVNNDNNPNENGWTEWELDQRPEPYHFDPTNPSMEHHQHHQHQPQQFQQRHGGNLKLHLQSSLQQQQQQQQKEKPTFYHPQSWSKHFSSDSPFTTSTVTNSIFSVPNKQLIKKTGTTIAGCICRGHVILATDTRATEGNIVADKTAQKLHLLAPNAWCAGAGTSADLEMITRQCRYTLSLSALQRSSIGNGKCIHMDHAENGMDENQKVDGNTTTTTTTKQQDGFGLVPMYGTMEDHEDENPLLMGMVSSVEEISSFLQDHLWQHQGQLGAYLILGCVTPCGKAHLCTLHPHGNMDNVPFAALGSGGLAAMSVLEQGYSTKTKNPNMTVPEAIELVRRAIVAGIQNDMGSGSQVDMCVISPDGTSTMTRAVTPSQVLQDLSSLDTNERAMAGETKKESAVSSPQGANVYGFGNTPFAVKSKRMLVSNKKNKEVIDQWNELFGSQPQQKP